MPLVSGTRLGPYEILSPLGAGGMGEVYRARDTRLGRDVAVKVLPQHLSSNPEVRARFEREAKTVSSLNHPHICTLFDVGREGDTDYLVMELIEGETLAERVARGPLPPADVLKIGTQIADALDRAHRAGVIHRDMKPGNVMLTKSGTKLMDFGLARGTGLAPATGSGASLLTQSPTVAQPLTAEGTIIGTFQYMSPEQLEGRETDARSDIWALGCVLYEMVTGKRAFDGATQASLISSIMRDEPRAMSELAPMSPPALERLVRQCLAKDPDERWQTAGDVRRELEWIAGGSAQIAVPAATYRRRGRFTAVGWIVAGLLAIVAVYALGPGRSHPADKELVRFNIDAPPGMTIAGTAEMTLSPDGRVLAFVGFDSTRVSRICLRALSMPEARVLPGTEKATLPFWSPDGRHIGFFADGKLRRIAADGTGKATVVCDAPDGRGGAWSKDGVILLAPGNQSAISRVSANGGTPTPVTRLREHERGHRYPQFLPDQKHFLYVAVAEVEETSTFLASIDGGESRELMKAGSKGFWTPGYLLYVDTGVNSVRQRLLARRFDEKKLQLSGDAHLVLDPVNANNFGYPNVAAGAGEALAVQHNRLLRGRVQIRDRRGALLRSLPQAFTPSGGVGGAVSPDGRRLAVGGADPLDLFVIDLETGVPTRLTFENKAVNNAVWSPDGTRLVFSRLSSGFGWRVYTKATDGTGPDSLLFSVPGLFSFPLDWSRDGRWLLARCADTRGEFDLWKIPMNGSGAPSVYQQTPELELFARLSPDGKWLACVSREGDQQRVYVQSFPDPGAKYQVAIENPVGVRWGVDGLTVRTTDRVLYAINVSTSGGFRQGTTERLFRLGAGDASMGFTPDGNIVILSLEDIGDIAQLEVVLNWTRLLEEGK